MRHLLDTHVAVWWLTDDRKLPKDHARLIERAERTRTLIGVSAMSLWEIAKLAALGPLDAIENVNDFLEQLELDRRFTILPLTAKIAVESTLLGARFPNDPGDQIIAATARCHGLTLLTADQRIIDSGVVAVA